MWLCANGVVCFCVSVSMQFRVVVFVSYCGCVLMGLCVFVHVR